MFLLFHSEVGLNLSTLEYMYTLSLSMDTGLFPASRNNTAMNILIPAPGTHASALCEQTA